MNCSSVMRRAGLSLAMATFCLLNVSGTANAEEKEVITRMSAGRIERIVQAFREVKEFKEVGNNTYRFEVNGLKMALFNKGETMQLYAVFNGKVTLSRINEWNKTKRFSRAYLDRDDDPVLESDLDLEGGVTEENVDAWIRTYVLSLRLFKKHLEE